RFVLFNAEEQGLIGSQAYARLSKSRGEPIVAVWQMDMIGYNKLEPRTWEVHAGFEASPAVEARSRRLADILRTVPPQVSADLPEVQVYHSATVPEGDPASRRSDHASFQAQGYPACVISEDFFVGPGADAPAPEENPQYHRPGDTFIDEVYVADIARAIAAAAWATVSQPAASSPLAQLSLSSQGQPASAPRELDTRNRPAEQAGSLSVAAAAIPRPARTATNRLTGSPATIPATGTAPAGNSLIERALNFVQQQSASLGFAAG